MVALYGYVFFGARLYSDAILQVYFFIVQIYGWWYWLRGRGDDGLVRPETMSPRDRAIWGAIAFASWLATGWFFSTYTNAVAPWIDASIAAMSVVAQYLLSIRKIENWALWIATDVVAVGLYFWKGLYPTTALYAVFLVLSIVGLIEWLRELRAQSGPQAAA